MLTPSLEDYLEEAYRLRISSGAVHCRDLALRLNVSLPSVTKAMKRLSRAGHVLYEPYGDLELTSKGMDAGRYLVVRNRVIQQFLHALGASGDVEAEAEAMEHYLQPETIKGLERLTAFLAHDGRWERARECV